MKLYTGNPQDIHAEHDEARSSQALLDAQLSALRERLREAPDQARRSTTLLEIGRTLLRMERQAEAWEAAREAFDLLVAAADWEGAVEASEVLFHSEQSESLAALGQGIWLAVTFPISPEISVEILRLVVEETPEDSDGAAVAAATAHYLADLRSSDDKERENLKFYTAQMLSSVARRHSNVTRQEEFDAWISRLELDEPDKFLIRLRNVVDVLVQDDWWIDRDAIQSALPVN